MLKPAFESLSLKPEFSHYKVDNFKETLNFKLDSLKRHKFFTTRERFMNIWKL